MRKNHFLKSVALFLSAVLFISSVPEYSFADPLAEIFNEVEINDDVAISDNEAEIINDVSEAGENKQFTDISLDDSYSFENNDAFFDEAKNESLAVGDVADTNASYIAKGKYKNVTWSIDNNGFLLVEGTGEYKNISDPNSSSPWRDYLEQIKSAKIKLSGTTKADYMFADCYEMTSIDLSEFDTSSVTDMTCMFSFCDSLKELNLKNFNTSKVTSMKYMFWGCSFSSLNIDSFDTSKVKTMTNMFCGCTGLKTLDVRGFDTSAVTDMSGMFCECDSLVSLDLRNFNTSSVTDMSNMFSSCVSLVSINLSNFNTSQVTNMTDMFADCSSLTSIDLSSFDMRSVKPYTIYDGAGFILSSLDYPLIERCNNLKSIKTPKNLSYYVNLPLGGKWYDADGNKWTALPRNYCYSCTLQKDSIPQNDYIADGTNGNVSWHLDKKGLLVIEGEGNIPRDERNYPMWCSYAELVKSAKITLSKTTDLSYLFYQCLNMESVDLSSLDTSSTKVMKGMFCGCRSLRGPSLSGFDTSRVYNMDDIFKGCSSLTELDLSSFDLRSVKDVYGYYGDDNGNIHTMYTYGNFFSGCNNLRKIMTPARLSIAVNLPNNLKWYDSDGNEWKTLPKNCCNSFTIQKGAAPQDGSYPIYVSNAKLEHGNVEITLDQRDLFSRASYEYNHNLCRFSIALSTLIYNYNSKDNTSVPKSFKELGFNTDSRDFVGEHYFPDESLKNGEGLYSPSWIVHKKIWVNGEDYTLVCVVIEGTKKYEWYDNFDPGIGDIHAGFERAAEYVFKNFAKYISDNQIDTSKMKLLITGHSRGAASANLLGKIFDTEVTSISSEDVYVYTFATPNVSKGEGVTAGVEPKGNSATGEKSKFRNIFNIINPQDFVTKVMPTAWGYRRYGYNYVLPNVYVNDYPSDFLTLYGQYKDDKTYDGYDHGMLDVYNYVNRIVGVVGNVNEYYSKPLNALGYLSNAQLNPYSLFFLFRNTLADYMVKKNAAVFAVPTVGGFGATGCDTVGFFGLHGALREEFRSAHTPETYLAFLNSEMTADQLTADKYLATSRLILVNCPVDVIVKDESGKILGEIRNNEINEDYNITMSVVGDSKMVLLPSDVEYNIELIGNDSGVMDYSIAGIDVDCGEISRTTYIGVPVEEGLTYTQTIEPETSVEEVVLLDESNEVVEPTGYFTEENRGQLSVDVTTVNGGYADGFVNLTPGDYVTLSAFPDENNSFVGWFDENGELVSSDAEYGISVSKNLDFTAVFTDKLNEYSDSIYVAYDSCGGTGGHILFDVVKDSTVVIPSEAPTKPGYNFLGWYTEKNGQGTRVTDKMKVRDNLVLYAYWVKENCTITFATDRFEDYNDVSGNVTAMSPVTVQGGTTYLFTAPAPIEGYSFGGWYTGENGTGEKYTDSTMIIDDVTLYPFWKHTGFSVGTIEDCVYTGAPITPSLEVYDGARLLEENRDYTLEFVNNINAADKGDENAPTIIVNGIGNYAGSAELTFSILPKDLGDDDLTAKDIVLNYKGGGLLFVVPAISHNGKALVSGINKDYTFEIYAVSDYETPIQSLTKTGSYKIVATGHGNYTGTREINLEVAELKPISKVSVNKIYDAEYTGEAIEPEVTLTYEGRVLRPYRDDDTSYDYSVSYSNNVDAGIATITITGNRAEGFSGTRTVKFEIKGTPINKVAIKNADGSEYTNSYLYTGSYIRPKLSLTVKKGDTVTTLESGTDYTLTYLDNKEVGTATIRIIGKGRYTGTKEITFAITPYSLKKDTEGIVEVNGIPVTDGKIVFPEGEEIKVPYTKGSVKVSDLTVTFNGKKLTLGTDYSVSYTNSKKAADCTDAKAPTLTIKGKGSFADSLSFKFTITKQSIASESVSMTLTEPEYTNQTGIWKVKPALKESNGQTLKEGTDYDNITYTYLNDTEVAVKGETVSRTAGDLVNDKDIIPIGTVIRITVTGKGNYGATDDDGAPYTRSADYIVRSETISAAVVGIAVQDYVGTAVIPDAADITVTVAGRSTPLTYGVDYTIEACSNNVNVGDEATVIIRGIGDYSGIITRSFTIKAKEISWWWTID